VRNPNRTVCRFIGWTEAVAANRNDANGPWFAPDTFRGRILKGSVYEKELELLRDVMVDLVQEDDEVWGGAFELNHPRQHIVRGTSYRLKLEDGRSGAIFIVDFEGSPEWSDLWVSFRGSGALC
jgi:hypothetical protein